MSALSNKYVFKNSWVRCAVGVLDALGRAATSFRKKPDPAAKYKRILVVRLDQLGDVVMTLPAVRLLREAFPDSRVDFLVAPWARDLVEPYADEIHVFENSYFGGKGAAVSCLLEWISFVRMFRRNRYDLAVDFRGDLRTAALLYLSAAGRRVGYGNAGGGFFYTDCLPEREGRHQSDRALDCVRLLGCEVRGEVQPFRYRSPDPEMWREKFSALALASRPWIVMHVGSGYASKRWPADRFFNVIDRLLSEAGGTVILTGHQKETEIARPYFKEREGLLNFIQKTTLLELCALIDKADLFVGNDSGPAHLAAALGKKTLVLFSGTNDWRLWHPRGQAVHVMRHDVSCSPCHERECPLPRHECMENITVDSVRAKIGELLRG